MAYWMGGAGFFVQYSKMEDVPPVNIEGYQLVKEIELRFQHNFYKQRKVKFNPADDKGSDWTACYSDLDKHVPIPDMMYEPVI